MKLYVIAVLTVLPLLLAACASGPTREQRAADFQAAAGAPVKSFNYVDSMYSWEPLNDHALVVYPRPNRAWLLDVGSCPELSYTNSIGLTSTVGQVSVGFDRVITDRRQFPCYIKSIRPIDLDRVHAVQAERRKIESMSREPGAPAK